jgi:hypothetical protein
MKILTKLVRENRQATLEEQTMKQKRCKMYHRLIVCAGNAILCLGVQGYRAPEHLESDDPAVKKLESAGTSMDGIVEAECRHLLKIAATRVFSNLRCLDPSFDFSAMLQRVEAEDSIRVGDEVEEHVDALLKLFEQVDDDEDGESSGDDSDDGAGEEAEEDALPE